MSTAPGLEVYFGGLWNEPISGSPVTPFLWPPSPGEACAEAPGGLKSMALCLAPPSRCRVLGCRLPLVPALQEKGSWPAAPLAPRVPIGSSGGQAQWAAQTAIVNHTACRCLPTWPALRLGQSLWWELLAALIGPLSGGGRPRFSLVFTLAAALPSRGGRRASWSGWLCRPEVHPCSADGERETLG